MKRFLWIPLLFLCSTLWAAEPVQLVRMTPHIVGAGVAAAAPACTTANDSALWDDTATEAVNAFKCDTTLFTGVMFNIAASTTITEYKINVLDRDQAGNLVLSLYTNKTSSCPFSAANCWDTEISGTSVSVANTSISDYPTLGVVTFTLATPKTGVSGNVWLVAKGTDAGNTYSFETNACVDNPNDSKNFHGEDTYFASYSAQMGVWGCAE